MYKKKITVAAEEKVLKPVPVGDPSQMYRFGLMVQGKASHTQSEFTTTRKQQKMGTRTQHISTR